MWVGRGAAAAQRVPVEAEGDELLGEDQGGHGQVRAGVGASQDQAGAAA